jgi:hypothetical protein
MNTEDLGGAFTNIERRLTSFDETVQGVDSRLSRIEDIVQEMSHGITRLTWAVNLWGTIIMIFVGMTLATARQ